MDHDTILRALIAADFERMRLLAMVRSLGLQDCWVGAGFVRDAVWDVRHGRTPTRPYGDVDVVWFNSGSAEAIEDRRLEARLGALDGSVRWSVKNQARMHRRNGDTPYASTIDAMRHWPETATAIAVRQMGDGACEIAAPFGLTDLFNLIVRPTLRFAGDERGIVRDRVRAKAWLERWPNLRLDL